MTGKRPQPALALWWLAFVAPLIVPGAAWVLWTISDRVLWIGPMDRAFFGWAVVVPLFVSVAPVAALTWRSLDGRGQMLAAAALGASVTLVCAVLLARSIGSADCQTAALRTTLDGLVAGAAVGLVGGAGLAAAGLVGARTAAARRGVLVAAALGLAASVAWFIGFSVAISFPGCARP